MDPVRVDLAPLIRYRGRIAQALAGGGGDDNPVRRALRQWAAIYRAFLRERFDRFSRGGGEWKALAESTILARRAKGGGTRRQKAGKARKAIARAGQSRLRAGRRLETLMSKGQGYGEKADKLRSQIDRASQRIARARRTVEEMPTMAGISILRDKGLLFNVTAPAFTGAPGQIQEDIPMGIRVGFGGPARYPDGTATIADIASFHQDGGPHLPQRTIVVPPDNPTYARMGTTMERALDLLAREG